jgi:uncharacterized protein (TIGR03067 family)
MSRRIIACMLLSAVLSSLAHAGTESDAREMDGIWKPLSAELAGKKYPQKILDTIKLVVKDGKYMVEVGGLSDEGTVTYDPAKSPKTMDIKGTKGINKGKTFLVIYEMKGDEMRVCYDLSGKSRPTEFATKADTMLYLVTYRKVKP